jgi:hypothetical protein
MKGWSGIRRVACGAGVVLLGAVAVAMAASGYHLLKKYSFGPAEGSTREYFDYITVDSVARRVYVSHGTEVKVLDADNGSLVGNITGLKQVHGVAVASEFGRGFVSDGAQGKVIIFDLSGLKVTGEAKGRQGCGLRDLRSGDEARLFDEWRPAQRNSDRCDERERSGDGGPWRRTRIRGGG